LFEGVDNLGAVSGTHRSGDFFGAQSRLHREFDAVVR
jgi:hypothetical protein